MKIQKIISPWGDMKTNELLIKAEKEAEKSTPTDFKFINEYLEALFLYYNDVFNKIVKGVARAARARPEKIKKSFEYDVEDLIKISQWDDFEKSFFKSIISTSEEKTKNLEKLLKKFNINNGKKPGVLNLNGKFLYNPNTKKILTNEEWEGIGDSIVEFLKDYIGTMNEEMIVRAMLFGKLISRMEEKGIPRKKIQETSWEDIQKEYGEIPRDEEEAQKTKNYFFEQNEIENLNFAEQESGKHLSISDSEIKNKIVNTTRDIITEGLRENKKPHEMVSDFYHTSKKEKQRGIKEWNRDIQRIINTEIKSAKSSGYLTATKNENKRKGKEKTYVMFSGAFNPDEKPDEPCNIYIGKFFLVVDEAREDDKIKDEFARYCTWPGKNNVGRKKANWWGCIPIHPHCKHEWVKVDPEIFVWDKKEKMLVYRED